MDGWMDTVSGIYRKDLLKITLHSMVQPLIRLINIIHYFKESLISRGHFEIVFIYKKINNSKVL